VGCVSNSSLPALLALADACDLNRNRDAPFPVIPSGGIQSKLEQADADVILILDCCFSATTPITGFQQNGKVMEVVTACGYETTAAEADQHSFTKALTHILAGASKGPPFTIGELHGRILSRLKCYAPELEVVDGNYVDTADGRLRLEPQVRRTPIYSTLCKTTPPRSIVLAPLRQLHATPTLDHGEETSDPSSTGSSTQCDSNKNDQSQSRKRKRPLEDDGKCPQIILAVRLTKGGFDQESWLEWIRNAPSEAEKIHVEGKYDSFSTLLLLRMPVSIWNLLPENPAYSFVGFVTSENMARGKIPTCSCINLCDECIRKIRAAKASIRHQAQDHDMDLFPSQENQSKVNAKRAREDDEDDSDVDTPRSTGSSVTEVEEQAPQRPSQSLNYYDPLRSDAMDEDANEKSPDSVQLTARAGATGFSPSPKEVASSLGALHINPETSEAQGIGGALSRGTLVPMTSASEEPDNRFAPSEKRPEMLRKAQIDPVPPRENDMLPLSRSIATALAALSAPIMPSDILEKNEVNPGGTLPQPSSTQQTFTYNSPGPSHSSSYSHDQVPSQSYAIIPRPVESQRRTKKEWFWFCVSSRLQLRRYRY
jgi:hypothetical protein